jgi:hypothetical protein
MRNRSGSNHLKLNKQKCFPSGKPGVLMTGNSSEYVADAKMLLRVRGKQVFRLTKVLHRQPESRHNCCKNSNRLKVSGIALKGRQGIKKEKGKRKNWVVGIGY